MKIKKISVFVTVLIATVFSMWIEAALPIAPQWSGDLMLSPQNSLKIVLNLTEEENGKYSVTLDSPEQGAYGIPGVVNYLTADSLDISVPSLTVRYAATLKNTPEGAWAMGDFKQGMLSLPLVMLPGGITKPIRPQTPQPPFPYQTKEVSFENPEGGSKLSGTLTIPANAYEGTPVVLMVTGSGLQNRDEEIFDHKPFEVIADYLARIGIATLRYDDRGYGNSTGDGENATTADFASDAKAGLRYLRDKGEFGKVGILGHSEGASVAFMLGNTKETPDFIIGIGTPAVKGETILRDQLRRTLGDAGASEAIKNIRMAGNPWMTYFLDYDPASDIKGTHCPVFAVYGEKDVQVSPSLNKNRFHELQPTATVKEYPELNHLMQHAETGIPEEYYKIEETIAPEVLSDIGRFILQNR